ncbi:hypothetical protein D4R99_02510 [bacterium]|nr:MAG: hypothetical protein D4R99_02510 [bacterium]
MKENISKLLSLLGTLLFSVFATIMSLLVFGFWVFAALALLNWASLKYVNYSLFNPSLIKNYYVISSIIILFVYTYWVIENYSETEGDKIGKIEREKNDIIHKLTVEKKR